MHRTDSLPVLDYRGLSLILIVTDADAQSSKSSSKAELSIACCPSVAPVFATIATPRVEIPASWFLSCSVRTFRAAFLGPFWGPFWDIHL